MKKFILGFITGGIVSAITTFIITKKSLEKSTEIYIQEEVSHQVDVLRDRWKEEGINEYHEAVDILKKQEEEIIKKEGYCPEYDEDPDIYNDSFETACKKFVNHAERASSELEEKINYCKKNEGKEYGGEIPPPFVDKSESTKRKDPDIYQISLDEHYETDDLSYDLEELYYHPDAQDMSDANGVLIDDPCEVLTADIFSEFVEDMDIQEMVVRNEFLHKDFYVMKEFLK